MTPVLGIWCMREGDSSRVVVLFARLETLADLGLHVGEHRRLQRGRADPSVLRRWRKSRRPVFMGTGMEQTVQIGEGRMAARDDSTRFLWSVALASLAPGNLVWWLGRPIEGGRWSFGSVTG